MTTANKITIFRMLLVPFFIVQVLYYVQAGEEIYRLMAILSFGLAALSDGIDGYIARRYNQRSELGAILDPLADKFLLVSGVILLSLNNDPYLPRLPLWLAGTILGRDMLLLIGLIVIQLAVGKITVRPVLIGKVATVLQMVCILWGFFKWQANWLIIWSAAAAVCTGTSGIFYVFEGVRQLSAHPASAATPKQG